LAALDDDLLALWLDAGDGEELVLERLAGRGGVDVDLVLLALVLYDYYKRCGLVVPCCEWRCSAGRTWYSRHGDVLNYTVNRV
jgi:hypothetical protein